MLNWCNFSMTGNQTKVAKQICWIKIGCRFVLNKRIYKLCTNGLIFPFKRQSSPSWTTSSVSGRTSKTRRSTRVRSCLIPIVTFSTNRAAMILTDGSTRSSHRSSQKTSATISPPSTFSCKNKMYVISVKDDDVP